MKRLNDILAVLKTAQVDLREFVKGTDEEITSRNHLTAAMRVQGREARVALKNINKVVGN